MADASQKEVAMLDSPFMLPVEHEIIQGKKRKRVLFRRRKSRNESRVGGGRPASMGLFPGKMY